jgi:16S rRNA C967 or C1407 C5-methylase (RsmB/RsmF family)
MLPPLYLDLINNSTILDMAASPGGKTSEICALANNQIYVTATEVNEIRRDRLVYNLEKLGCKNVTTLRVDARNLDEFFSFDNILLDAPCSGSGTIEKNDFSKINEKLVTNITKVQESLLRKALSVLKPGKTMIYSTCSILKAENEEIINKMRKEFNIEIVPISIDFETLPSTIDGVQTIMPSETNEGFFICKIKKL